jgi:hypothetical protein
MRRRKIRLWWEIHAARRRQEVTGRERRKRLKEGGPCAGDLNLKF